MAYWRLATMYAGSRREFEVGVIQYKDGRLRIIGLHNKFDKPEHLEMLGKAMIARARKMIEDGSKDVESDSDSDSGDAG